MLRRKLMLFLGSVIALLALVLVVAIYLLQGVLEQMDHTARVDSVAVGQVSSLSSTITEVEIELREIQLRRTHHLDALIEHVAFLRQQVDTLQVELAQPVANAKELAGHVRSLMPKFERHVGALATTQDAELAAAHTQAALEASVAARRDILELSRLLQDHVQAEEQQTVTWFRWLVLGLAVVFLMVINISVMVLLRMVSVIVRPVEQLVEASRELAAERFGYRVQVLSGGEFTELGQAFNKLASALEASEQRKLETLGHVALTLNHELNNASAVIQMQLALLGKQSNGNPMFEKCLRQIQESCDRMSQTVEALKNVRRIVLTDYVSGVKMLDLAASVAPPACPPPPAPHAPPVQGGD